MLLDLCFLLHSFWQDIPDSLLDFSIVIAALAPGGVYDTKHIIEAHPDRLASLINGSALSPALEKVSQPPFVYPRIGKS